MPAALPLQNLISQASQGDRDYRVIEVKYGNGYSQRARDGVNSVVDAWSIEYANISYADLTTIYAAFDLAAGVDYFTWQAPGDTSTKKWVVAKCSKAAMSGGVYSVTAELKQVFDL